MGLVENTDHTAVLVPAKLAVLHPVTDEAVLDAGGVIAVILSLEKHTDRQLDGVGHIDNRPPTD